MSTEGGGASSPAQGEAKSEDAFLVHNGLGLYVVADGASEGPAGEIAAKAAVTALEVFVRRSEAPSLINIFRSSPSKATAFDAVLFALERVVIASGKSPELEGMLTTVTMLLVHRDRAVVGHVGDSRLYLLRDGILHQLTSDHPLTHTPGDHSADTYQRTPIQSFAVDPLDGDTFLLCTDGAVDVVGDATIVESLVDCVPNVAAAKIVQAARRLHPHVDATAVVVRVLSEAEAGWLSVSEPVRPWAFGHTLEYA